LDLFKNAVDRMQLILNSSAAHVMQFERLALKVHIECVQNITKELYLRDAPEEFRGLLNQNL